MDPHFYLGGLSEEITMQPSERAASLARASALEMSMKGMLPHIRELRPFGSVVRGTALSRKVSPTVDLDCLICTDLAAAQQRFSGRKHDEAEELMIEELCEALESIVSPAIVTLQHQWIVVELDGVRFEFSVGRRSDSWTENIYLMYVRDSKWLQAHPKLQNRYGGNSIRAVRNDGSEDEEALVAAEPFALDYSGLNEWEQTLVTGLIVILKYWNRLYQEKIPSFVLESNVEKWVYSEKPKGRPRSIFELVCAFFQSSANYDRRIFGRLASFQTLRKAFRAAHELTVGEREEDAVKYLAAVLPWPDRLQHFEPFMKKGLSTVQSSVAELDRQRGLTAQRRQSV